MIQFFYSYINWQSDKLDCNVYTKCLLINEYRCILYTDLVIFCVGDTFNLRRECFHCLIKTCNDLKSRKYHVDFPF